MNMIIIVLIILILLGAGGGAWYYFKDASGKVATIKPGTYSLQNVQAKKMLSAGSTDGSVVLGSTGPPGEWIITPSTFTSGTYSLQNVQAKNNNSTTTPTKQMLCTNGTANYVGSFVGLYGGGNWGPTSEWIITHSNIPGRYSLQNVQAKNNSAPGQMLTGSTDGSVVLGSKGPTTEWIIKKQ